MELMLHPHEGEPSVPDRTRKIQNALVSNNFNVGYHISRLELPRPEKMRM